MKRWGKIEMWIWCRKKTSQKASKPLIADPLTNEVTCLKWEYSNNEEWHFWDGSALYIVIAESLDIATVSLYHVFSTFSKLD